MGFLDKLKEKGRGVVTSAKPDEGVEAQPASVLLAGLQAISGKGIQTEGSGDQVVVSWSAKIAGAGVSGAGYEYLYRAIRLELREAEHEASALCLKTTTDAELSGIGSLSAHKSWERGQHVGSETVHVIAWLGPHATSAGADEKGYSFSWGDLREQVMDAVTGAGWTYQPAKI